MDAIEGRSDIERVRPVLILVAVLAGLDITLDAPTDWFTPHILLELSLPAQGS